MTTNIAFIYTIILDILNSLSLTSKYPVLFSFCSKLKKFNGLNLRKGRTKEKKSLCIIMHHNYIMSI